MEGAQDQGEEEEAEQRDMTTSQVLTSGCPRARVLCHR